MMDLTKIDKPFGLLDAETQRALRDWPHGWELYAGRPDWAHVMGPQWDNSNTYRARPAPVLTKPSIDWSHVADGWNWLAVDGDGGVWLYDGRPDFAFGKWLASGAIVSAEAFAYCRPGTCDWRDSLICRPGFEVAE